MEFLSQSKIRKNKSPAPAFHSYELHANYSNSFLFMHALLYSSQSKIVFLFLEEN